MFSTEFWKLLSNKYPVVNSFEMPARYRVERWGTQRFSGTKAATGMMQVISYSVSNNEALRKLSAVVHPVCADRKKSSPRRTSTTSSSAALPTAIAPSARSRTSSQAKGRVERANRTLQDRLVKELRLAGICDMAAGNVFLPAFLEHFNERFAVPAQKPENLHGGLTNLKICVIDCEKQQSGNANFFVLIANVQTASSVTVSEPIPFAKK